MRSLASLALLALAAAAARPPTPAALRKAFENNEESLVHVVGPKAQGPGVVIGGDGHVLTSVSFVGLDEATVRLGDRALPASVVLADAYAKFAVVRIQGAPQLRAAAARLEGGLELGAYLLAARRTKKGKVAPTVVQVKRPPRPGARFFEVDELLVAGTALFDPKGKLVAIAVGRSSALPLTAVKAQLAALAARDGGAGAPP
jgi:hypothetical protein